MPILQGILVITFDIQNHLHIKKSPTTLKNKELDEKNNLENIQVQCVHISREFFWWHVIAV
jgi:hypothetical protein